MVVCAGVGSAYDLGDGGLKVGFLASLQFVENSAGVEKGESCEERVIRP